MPKKIWLFAFLLCSYWASAFALAPLKPVEIAPGVYVIPAEAKEISQENEGRVVNTGFVVGSEGVAVIDSGANHSHGKAIIAAIRSVTNLPIHVLINTHPHPQNVLGNTAFSELGISILATEATRDAMQTRCPQCLKSLTDIVGTKAMAGTQIRIPDRLLKDGERLRVGGRNLQFFHFGHGHTEGDLLVMDEATQVIFAGDLVYRAQIPHMSEASTSGWRTALEKTSRLPFRILVPGRGPVGTSATILPMLGYLNALQHRVGEAYGRGLSPEETIAWASQPEFSDWEGYATRHGRNVQHVYFELERRDFFQDVAK